jgi:hypothetical protein
MFAPQSIDWADRTTTAPSTTAPSCSPITVLAIVRKWLDEADDGRCPRSGTLGRQAHDEAARDGPVPQEPDGSPMVSRVGEGGRDLPRGRNKARARFLKFAEDDTLRFCVSARGRWFR